MRRKTSKILLLPLLAGLLPLSGFAHAHKATTGTVAKASAKPAAQHVSAHVEKASARAKPTKPAVEVAAPGKRSLHGGKAGSKAKLEPVAARSSTRKAAAAKAPASTGKGWRAALKSTPPKPVRGRASEPIAEVSPANEPLPESSALPEIHVTHNRKQHLKAAEPVLAPDTASGTTPIADAAPLRKARPQDFLTTGAGSSAAPLTGVSRPDVEPITTSEGPASAPVAPSLGTALRMAAPTARSSALAVPVAPSIGAALRVAPPVQVIAVLRKPAPVMPVREARETELLPPPVPTPALYTKSGRLIMPAALKGSHDILIHQNVMAEQDGLERVQDDDDLFRMRQAKLLLAIPETAELRADERLPGNRRYARPWTVAFLEAIAKAHYERFHGPLQVNSAVRTVEFQERLIRTNGNAAPADGDTASPHLTGQAIDLAKKPLSQAEIAWMRGYLLPLVQEGKIDVEEEFQQACFHISVYRKYMPQAAPKRPIVPRRMTGMALAAAMP